MNIHEESISIKNLNLRELRSQINLVPIWILQSLERNKTFSRTDKIKDGLL